MKRRLISIMEKFGIVYLTIPIVLLGLLISLLFDYHWGIFYFRLLLFYLTSILGPFLALFFILQLKVSWLSMLWRAILPFVGGILLFLYTNSMEYVPYSDLRKDELRYENHQILKPRRF